MRIIFKHLLILSHTQMSKHSASNIVIRFTLYEYIIPLNVYA